MVVVALFTIDDGSELEVEIIVEDLTIVNELAHTMRRVVVSEHNLGI